MNKRVLFNQGWLFAKSDLSVDSAIGLDFQPVEVPHDWLIFQTEDLYEHSIGWYKKTLHLDKVNDRVILQFDGVYMDSSLYVNGQFIGEWKYGYSAFEHEITDQLINGENEILLKVVYQSPNSRWYTGAGIYRDVWLKTRSQNYIESDGIYITTRKEADDWQVEVETDLQLESPAILKHELFDRDKKIAESTVSVSASQKNEQRLTVEQPKVWSPESPNLYELKTTLLNQSGQVIEEIDQRVGFRTVRLDPNHGLFINDVKTQINGVCEHHDLGALGAAFNPVALRRRFKILKQMGVNGIRTAHNMPAKELMDLADEFGFLVVSEAFDMWERPKTKYDYARFFKEWAYRDVKNWVKRDRNHPSLIMWGIGNEVYDTHADELGQELTQMLKDYVEEFDPKQNAYVTFGSNYLPWENTRKAADLIKIVGYNYGDKYYHDHHDEYPDWVIYGSETVSVVQSRGIYHFPLEEPILADDDEQCSALGNSSTSWGAKSHEASIIAHRDAPYTLGQFIWTGFDYIGEPTPYHTKNSYFGQIDTATFPKDTYYIYQASWTDYKTAPMIHVFPYWDFNPGQMIDVRVASNAPKVELKLNGRSLGIKEINHQSGTELVPTWKVAYEPGEITAIAYDENDQVIATDQQKSFEDATKVVLTADKKQLIANGQDLIFVEINTEDDAGNQVKNATNRVTVDVTGAGRLVGLDNGDSTDIDQYKGISRRLFSGKLMAIIQATDEVGEIHVRVSSNHLTEANLTLEAVPNVQKVEHKINYAMNQPTPIKIGQADEIPVRKIELISTDGQAFSPELTETTIEATLYPADTTYREIEWSVVTDSGVKTNIATIEPNGATAKVTAVGDGRFRVRATTKNGTDKVKLISELDMIVAGLGEAYKNPYDFISGGLYDDHVGEVTSGNERGVATSRDGETIVGYHKIDFGKDGSDEITIPIFALSDEEYPIEIWQGKPDEADSHLLADVIYQKESRWNVYQSDTYKLSKRITGLTSIYFRLQAKVHIKGFSFTPYARSLAKNYVKDADHIYGDSFTFKADVVEGIGNNVSFAYDAMDFGTAGISKLTVCGHSPIDKNTIHVRFIDEEGQENQIIEFTETADYEERQFELDRITGKKTVMFIFLPGSNFNFSWFKFE
ncbi:glycoside hydrolase family 2 TIM barrel-domain containing protein [Amphibacillus indicireducens]|uniref:Beta-galactosidase n=1 Tax=Amphibacillus indicireducens TaxID=1076330 RepID=A0ABP7VVU1_9BACI